jgi:hypothetical protein
MALWHGTSIERLDSILREGLRPGSYVIATFDLASSFAWLFGADTGGVVLRLVPVAYSRLRRDPEDQTGSTAFIIDQGTKAEEIAEVHRLDRPAWLSGELIESCCRARDLSREVRALYDSGHPRRTALEAQEVGPVWQTVMQGLSSPG